MLKGKKWRKFEDFYEAVKFMTEKKRVQGGIGLIHTAPKAYQNCLDMYSSMKDISATENINHLNHYVYGDCTLGQMTFCLRERDDSTVLTTHPVGECPLCKYEEG